jgi:hypothetical protein
MKGVVGTADLQASEVPTRPVSWSYEVHIASKAASDEMRTWKRCFPNLDLNLSLEALLRIVDQLLKHLPRFVFGVEV